MSNDSKYQFPTCLHPVSAALHMLGINPADMVIELPREQWWTVYCEMERRFARDNRSSPFDGRGPVPSEFICMGVRFRAR